MLPGPEERSLLESLLAAIDDGYRPLPPGLARLDREKPLYPEQAWQVTTSPLLIFSDSIDSELAPTIWGVTPIARGYIKVNVDAHRFYAMPLEQTILHEQDHLREAEPYRSLSEQEQGVRYRRAGYTGDWSQLPPEPWYLPR